MEQKDVLPVPMLKSKHPKALYVLFFYRDVGTLCLLPDGWDSSSLPD
jgi:hypothetical protein